MTRSIVELLVTAETMSLIYDKDHPIMKEAFERILTVVCAGESPGLITVGKWMKAMLTETVAGGKLTRGLLLLHTYLDLKANVTEDNLRRVATVAWMIEMFHAVGLILDDIIDGSSTRRGKICWYKRPDVGLMAVNDAILLEQLMYKVLYEVLGEGEQSYRIERCFRLTSFSTVQGQCLDILCERERTSDPLVYEELVRTKTSTYTFMFPMRLALILADVIDKELETKIERVGYKIGEYFQIQDDYLDCFGDPEVSGKIGSDIVNGKCTWLWVKSMQEADERQRKVLRENYGCGKIGGIEELAVISIYEQLGLRELFSKTEKTLRKELEEMLKECDFPFKSFQILLAKISGRKA